MTEVNTAAPVAAPVIAPEVTPTPTPEVTKVETKAAEEKIDVSRFAALTKKEKEILRKSKELAQREKMLTERYSKWEQADQIKNQSKLEALKSLGLSYEDLTNEYLGQANQTPTYIAQRTAQQTAHEEIEKFKKQYEEQQQTIQAQQYEAGLKQVRGEVEYMAANVADYPLVKEFEAYDTVVDKVVEIFNETGRISVKEAINHVEQSLVDYGLKLSQHEKIRSKLNPPKVEEPKPELSTQAEPTNTQQKTLTNKNTVSSSIKAMTPSERRQRAIDIFYGKLKE
jgi:hypothetical protein